MTKLLINISTKQAFIYASFLVLYEFLTYIANDMIMPGMITVVQTFNGPESAIATSLTMYLLGGSSLQLFLGPISDYYGRRPVMIFGVFFFFACTILIAFTQSISQFLLMRFFQGMGLCFISVIGYSTLQEIFAEMEAVRLISVMSNVAILAPLIGPLLGVLFIYFFSWRYIFIVIGSLALISLCGLWRFMPESVGQIKTDGEEIKRISLAPKTIALNYFKLLSNLPFVLGSVALGIIYLPCMAWIGLAPIILVTAAKLSLFEYCLWQIPVFGAFLIGNICLRHMTHKRTLKQLIRVGSWFAVLSLLVVYLLPLFISDYFVWLMPGLIAYFFGASMIGGPMSRFILFSTEVSKGTASALMTAISMCIQAAGLELATVLYGAHNNGLFGLYCLVSGICYAGLVAVLLVREG